MRSVCLLAIAALVAAPRLAAAGEMDLTTERLVEPSAPLPAGQTCQSVAANPEVALAAGLRPAGLACRPNNVAFANLVSELGFAIAPTSFYPARSTGLAGFQVSFEASYTNIAADRSVPSSAGDQRYWHLGTRGAQSEATNQRAVTNTSPDGLLQIYALKARKGLPLGFELAGSLGTIANTGMWVYGGDLRWSMLEGFRTGPLGYVPDVSVGGGVRTLTGSSRLHLTTVGIDVRASKSIVVADAAELIPQVGFQRLIIFGDSNVVDATPQVDAVAQCGQTGNDPTTGAPTCRNKLSDGSDANADFANNITFDSARIHRSRLLFALNYRYEIVWLGSQLAFDITDPKDENPQVVGPRQWTLSLEGGVRF